MRVPRQQQAAYQVLRGDEREALAVPKTDTLWERTPREVTLRPLFWVNCPKPASATGANRRHVRVGRGSCCVGDITIESAKSVRKKPRVQWTEKETWALIKLWEDHLDAMRGHKHNGGLYQAIAECLTDAGIPRTRAHVHSRIDNLTQTFRKIERELTTGSSPPTWPYYSEIKRFIGCLPINDPSLMEESCCNSSSDTVQKLIYEMESGVSSEATETDSTPVPGTPTEPQPPPAPTTQWAQSPATSTAARATRRPRRPLSAAREFQEAMLAEQKKDG
ncbi:uncharacterized protein LOC125759958 [Rhipicephalus sanguineus]|uniref:uncharacterized protein LOC125759958 n=1 Tax=Rhipicephalus sanguineus TaxID=34632 RepID=UPI0020C35B7E|nr:uncharacterized protein LOC125759958 [Rhipicephalus sanguineus]